MLGVRNIKHSGCGQLNDGFQKKTLDYSSLKSRPATNAAGRHPTRSWRKQGMDRLELCVDSGAGFVFQAIVTVLGDTDNAVLTAPGASAQGGQCYDVASIPLAG